MNNLFKKVVDYTKKSLNLDKKDTISQINNENRTIQDVSGQNKKEIFKCFLEIHCSNSELSDIANTTHYFKEMDDDEYYLGLKDDEIEEKVYENNGYSFPCEIKGNKDRQKYEVYYTEHYRDTFVGDIPDEFSDKVEDIILNKTITYGGMTFKGGRYKIYDKEKQEVVKKYDDYIVELTIKYK